MAVRVKRKKIDQDTVVVMSEMDFEIAKQVYIRYNEIGLYDEEVSFLLGKPNKYVFDLINPSEKDKFKTEQIDVLPTILNCKIRNIIPNNLVANQKIQVRATQSMVGNKLIFTYTTKIGKGELTDSETFEKTILKGERKKLHTQVHDFTFGLIGEGHFSSPKNALELYLLYKEHVTQSFRPADLQKSLSDCMRNQGEKVAVLKRTIINARYHYIASEEV